MADSKNKHSLAFVIDEISSVDPENKTLQGLKKIKDAISKEKRVLKEKRFNKANPEVAELIASVKALKSEKVESHVQVPPAPTPTIPVKPERPIVVVETPTPVAVAVPPPAAAPAAAPAPAPKPVAAAPAPATVPTRLPATAPYRSHFQPTQVGVVGKWF